MGFEAAGGGTVGNITAVEGSTGHSSTAVMIGLGIFVGKLHVQLYSWALMNDAPEV